MLECISSAKVGDDVFGDDNLTLKLQDQAAGILGKDAALFVPSGTMANQIALQTHTQAGDEVILESGSHIYMYEGGGYASLAGVSVKLVQGDRGIMDPVEVKNAIRPPGGLSHYPKTKLICVENTANAGGGTVYPLDVLDSITNLAVGKNLKTHLDGARVFNAAISSGIDIKRIVRDFDSVSFCLSKGLGCPVGSLLCGSYSFIKKAHRFRKMLGGGMRQTGFLAAAGIFALEKNIERLEDDHIRARKLAKSLIDFGYGICLDSVETNMVYIDVSFLNLKMEVVIEFLKKNNVLIAASSDKHLRAVMHLGINNAGLQKAIDVFQNLKTIT
ncbi:threonine aldolase [bacterium]|nr:threonine aldolase [bacterium]